MVRISFVCGSLPKSAKTKMALSVAMKGASEFDVEVKMIELRNYELVFYGSMDEKDYPSDVHKLKAEIKASDGIILGTPEYHGSMSGVLKNMLDLTGQEEWEGKIVGLIGVAGGHTGAINSLNTMRIIGRNLHCWVLPQEVSIANSSKIFNEDGSLNDPKIEDRLLNMGRQVVKFANLQQKIRNDDFMKLWEGLPTW